MSETPSRVAGLSRSVGFVGVGAFALGPLLNQAGLVAPMVGFGIFQLGLLCALVALVLGSLGILRTRPGSGRSGRGRALSGAGLGALSIAIVLAANGSRLSVPAINDITTDVNDPPRFTAAQKLAPNVGRDLGYPGESFAAQQQASYPDLAPLPLAEPPEVVFERALAVAHELGWEVTFQDAAAGTIEAYEVTPLFRFVDDVSVRIRASEAGSVVDVRSKSRDGRGDIGANADRIRRFTAGLAGDLPAVAAE